MILHRDYAMQVFGELLNDCYRTAIAQYRLVATNLDQPWPLNSRLTTSKSQGIHRCNQLLYLLFVGGLECEGNYVAS